MSTNFATKTNFDDFSRAMNDMQKSSEFMTVLKQKRQDGLFKGSAVVEMLVSKLKNNKIKTNPNGGKVATWRYRKQYSAAVAAGYLAYDAAEAEIENDNTRSASVKLSTYKKVVKWSDREVDYNNRDKLFNMWDEKDDDVTAAMKDYRTFHILGNGVTDVNGKTITNTDLKPAYLGIRYWIETSPAIVYGDETRSSSTPYINNYATTVTGVGDVTVAVTQAFISSQKRVSMDGKSMGPNMGYSTFTIVWQLQREIAAQNGGDFSSAQDGEALKYGFTDHVTISGTTIFAEQYISDENLGGYASVDVGYMNTFNTSDMVLAVDPAVDDFRNPVRRVANTDHLWFQTTEQSEQIILTNSVTAGVLSWTV